MPHAGRETPDSHYEDKYPSRRHGQKATVIGRKEPVVFASVEKQAPLSAELVASYRTHGFVVLDSIFSATDVELWLAELDRLRNDERIQRLEETITEPGSHAVRSIFSVHRLSRLMGRLSRNPRLVRIAEYLLDDHVYLHQSRLNYKPGFRGKEFFWHSDFETWHVEDGMPAMRALSMSISLTENRSTNGPLMLIPGSHHKFLACEGETPEQNYRTSLRKQSYGIPDEANLERMIEESGIVEFRGEPGSVCIFDCNVLHGSNSNISPFPRSNVFFVFNAMNNRVREPFGGQAPRPEYICAREEITPITALAEEMPGEEKS